MPPLDFREQSWATSPGRADKELTEENVLILSDHSVMGANGTTKLLACGCKPEHAENHK